MAPRPTAVITEESIIERLVANDHVRWWNKPNLRRLYLLLVPFCLFIESTSGFDSSVSFPTSDAHLPLLKDSYSCHPR